MNRLYSVASSRSATQSIRVSEGEAVVWMCGCVDGTPLESEKQQSRSGCPQRGCWREHHRVKDAARGRWGGPRGAIEQVFLYVCEQGCWKKNVEEDQASTRPCLGPYVHVWLSLLRCLWISLLGAWSPSRPHARLAIHAAGDPSKPLSPTHIHTTAHTASQACETPQRKRKRCH